MHRSIILSVFALLLLASVGAAQVQTPPTATPPPYLDDPEYWAIHGPNGDLGFELRAEYLFSDGSADLYFLEITGEVNGKPYYSWGIAVDGSDGHILDVYSADSGNWVELHWDADHYDKVGGTSAPRSYHPVN